MFGFFKRRKHSLPKFPSDVAPTFKALCEDLPVERVKELEPEVDRCLERFQELAEKYPHMNLTLANKIGERSKMLLAKYEDLSKEHRRLVIGAVRYFAVAEDSLSETTFAAGFHDDARVINYVLEELGMSDLCLAL